MKLENLIHPDDATALKALKSIPALPKLMEKVFQYGYDEISWSENVTTNLRLSEHQMPEVYNRLPPICKRLGIPIPELYLQMNPIPNAWTSGYNKVYIVLTLGLVKRLRGEEIDAVLAHECGHIVCQHVLYQTLANAVFTLGDALMDSFIGMIGSAAIKPMKQALITWSRAAELSADRVACIVTSADTLSRALARISGIPRYMIEYMNISVWAQQGKDYEALKNGTAWNKIVRWMANSDADHPYCPVRAYEAFEWEKTTAYAQMKSCQSSLRLYRGVEAMPSVTDNIKDKVSSLTDEIKNSAVTENIKDRVSSLTKEINTSAVAENIKDRMSTLAKDAKINSMFSMFNNKKK